jgi:hypothetical protein
MQVYRIPGVAAPRNIRTLQKASALTDPWLVGSPSGVLGVYDLSQADG